MSNEKYSEALVLQEMRCGLGRNDFGSVFPQGDVPLVAALQELLKKAGGKPATCALDDFLQGGNGKAKPEFIVTFDADRELMERSAVRLPATSGGEPDWKWMEDYIKGLPYSAALFAQSDFLSSNSQAKGISNA